MATINPRPSMKRLILLVCFIAASAMVANAQMEKKSPDQRAAHITRALKKKLNLSADQARQIDAIFLLHANRIDSLNGNQSSAKKLNHLTKRSISLSTQKSVLAILSDDQKQKFIAWEKEKKERHAEKKEAIGAKS
jgi:hypothetical protein